MATEEEKLQASLFDELEKNDVKVSGESAEKMKENIVNDKGGGSYLGVGAHEVFIKSVELVKANSGTFGLRLNVENGDGKNDATFWLSEGALPYTIENVSRLVVHNTAEDKKDDARTYMSNITSAKEVVNVAKQKLIDGVAILVVKESATRTYKNKEGVDVPSLEKNLQSWKPKDAPKQSGEQIKKSGKEEIDLSEIPF